MKTLIVRWTVMLVTILAFITLGCDPGYDPVMKGVVEFQLTDSPSDDADIQGVFVTITEIRADGQAVSGFTKQTVELKALQDGNSKLLATTTLVARSYSSLTLVLDTDLDANGGSPGCYVMSNSSTKYKLRSGKIEVLVNSAWSVYSNVKTAVVMDFDIRKAIRAEDNASVRYNFVSDDNLRAAIRVMNRDKVGAINGLYTDQSGVASDKVVVYAYKKGTYSAAVETQAQGEDKIYFKNAVCSAEIKGAPGLQAYTFAYLQDGEYEMHFASYKQNVGSTHFTFQTMLAADLTVSGSIMEFIEVHMGMSVLVNALMTGSM